MDVGEAVAVGVWVGVGVVVGVADAVGVSVGVGVTVGVAVAVGEAVTVGVAVEGTRQPLPRLSVTVFTRPRSEATKSEAQNCQLPVAPRPVNPANDANEPASPSGLGRYAQRPSSRHATWALLSPLPIVSASAGAASE